LYKVASINKGRRERKKLIRKRNKVFQPLTPMHFRYCEVFRKLGFPVDLNNHEYPNKPLLKDSYLEERINLGNKIIGIAPFASNEGKTYPLDHMQKVIAYLQKHYFVFLFGGGEDNLEQLRVWENAYNNVSDMSRKYSLTQQINIMYYLDVMISMDSANGHLAANCGIPVLSLWGLTHPFCGFNPFDQPIEHSLTVNRNDYPEIPTSIFGDKIPKNYESAFRSIEPKKVIEKTLEILDTAKYHHN
jgi:ADP-heptose:LPS heptosyltransferase